MSDLSLDSAREFVVRRVKQNRAAVEPELLGKSGRWVAESAAQRRVPVEEKVTKYCRSQKRARLGSIPL